MSGKKIRLLFILLPVVISCGDKEEELPEISGCPYSCEGETVMEVITSAKYIVVDESKNDLPFTLSPADKENEEINKDDILVPCYFPDEFKKDSLIVRISGDKKSCCDLLTIPNVRTDWGCKFEISEIELVEEENGDDG